MQLSKRLCPQLISLRNPFNATTYNVNTVSNTRTLLDKQQHRETTTIVV